MFAIYVRPVLNAADGSVPTGKQLTMVAACPGEPMRRVAQHVLIALLILVGLGETSSVPMGSLVHAEAGPPDPAFSVRLDRSSAVSSAQASGSAQAASQIMPPARYGHVATWD